MDERRAWGCLIRAALVVLSKSSPEDADRIAAEVIELLVERQVIAR